MKNRHEYTGFTYRKSAENNFSSMHDFPVVRQNYHEAIRNLKQKSTKFA